MSFGFQCENDSGHILISDRARSLHWVGDAEFVERIEGLNVRGGYNRLRYQIKTPVVPVPFFTTPTENAFYGIQAVSDQGDGVWFIEIICSTPQAEHTEWPRVLCFIDAEHVAPVADRWGMVVYDAVGRPCYDSRRSPLNVLGTVPITPPADPTIDVNSDGANERQIIDEWRYGDAATLAELGHDEKDLTDQDLLDIDWAIYAGEWESRYWDHMSPEAQAVMQSWVRLVNNLGATYGPAFTRRFVSRYGGYQADPPTSSRCGSSGHRYFTPRGYRTVRAPAIANEPAYHYSGENTTLAVHQERSNSDSCDSRWFGRCVRREYCSRGAFYWTLYRSGIRQTGSNIDVGWIAVDYNCAWNEECVTGWDSTFMSVITFVGMATGNGWIQFGTTALTAYGMYDVDEDDYNGGIPPEAGAEDSYMNPYPLVLTDAARYRELPKEKQASPPPVDWNLDWPWQGYYWDEDGNHVRIGPHPPPPGFDLNDPWQGYYWDEDGVVVDDAGPPSGWDLDLPYAGWFWDEQGRNIAPAPEPPPEPWDKTWPWEGFYWEDGEVIGKVE